MANSVNNKKLNSNYPGRFNRRENRASTHNHSALIMDSDATLETNDGVDYAYGTATGATTLTLPPASSNRGRRIRCYQGNTGSMQIAVQGSDTIDQAALLNQFEWIEYYCTGTGYLTTAEG